MPDLTPRDDIKKKVSEILKRVDQLLKGSELDQAVQQIARAKEIDPKNVYIFAYEERLNIMLEERKQREEIEAKERAVEEKKKKEEEEKRKAEEEKQRAREEEQRKAEEEKRKKEEAQRKAAEPPPRKRPDISRDILEDTKRKILEDRKKKGLAQSDADHSKSYSHAYEEGLDIYRRVLVEAWADGALTSAEEEQLRSLRASLQILAEDHERLEREAKIDAYSDAFRKTWSGGNASLGPGSSLAELRKKFKITIEEHENIEEKLLWELRSSNKKPQLLIIDDDEKLLKLVSETLQEAGFQTVAFSTSDEAYKYLQENTPDMVVSDINLETSTMGGFTFYEKVREIESMHEIPFIFLSGLTDEVLVRTGKEMGVDDYLTKPFSDETLIATIKGKLKRYRQLRKNRQKK